MPTITAEALVDAPCPRVGLTVEGLGLGGSFLSVWRTADGERNPVRGARRVSIVDAGYLVDYDAPLGRPITYELEVISGPDGASRTSSDPVTVETDTAWLMDPLVPQTAVPITYRYLPTGEPTFSASAMAQLDYAADTQVFSIMGSPKPMALFGQRMEAAGVDFSLITDAATENTRLRKLLKSTASLLVRVPASWTDALPGSCFALMAKVSEAPVEAGSGGPLTLWTLTGDTVAAPTIKVLTATFTYGDVAMLMSTYQQKQDLMAGLTYLDDLKHPIG